MWGMPYLSKFIRASDANKGLPRRSIVNRKPVMAHMLLQHNNQRQSIGNSRICPLLPCTAVLSYPPRTRKQAHADTAMAASA